MEQGFKQLFEEERVCGVLALRRESVWSLGFKEREYLWSFARAEGEGGVCFFFHFFLFLIFAAR